MFPIKYKVIFHPTMFNLSTGLKRRVLSDFKKGRRGAMEEDFERALDERDLLLILQVWLEVLGHRME